MLLFEEQPEKTNGKIISNAKKQTIRIFLFFIVVIRKREHAHVLAAGIFPDAVRRLLGKNAVLERDGITLLKKGEQHKYQHNQRGTHKDLPYFHGLTTHKWVTFRLSQ